MDCYTACKIFDSTDMVLNKYLPQSQKLCFTFFKLLILKILFGMLFGTVFSIHV